MILRIGVRSAEDGHSGVVTKLWLTLGHLSQFLSFYDVFLNWKL